MQINIKQLILDYNMSNPLDKLNQRKLARDMERAGIYTEGSAMAMIYRHQTGQTKSIDFALLQFLCDKFNVSPNDIIQ